MKPIRISIVLAMAALTACATANVKPPLGGPEWKDADKEGVALSKGAADCKYEAKVQTKAAMGSSKNASVEDDLFDSCMRRRGY
jgi:hypothetical protein